MNMILARDVQVCGVFAGNENAGFRYVIGSQNCDVRKLCKSLNAAFEGRGGGKPEMVQGSLKGTKNDIKKLFEAEVEEIRK